MNVSYYKLFPSQFPDVSNSIFNLSHLHCTRATWACVLENFHCKFQSDNLHAISNQPKILILPAFSVNIYIYNTTEAKSADRNNNNYTFITRRMPKIKTKSWYW